MNIQEVRNKLLSARETPFRNVFSSYVGSDFLPTLDDQESAFIFVASKEKIVEPTEIMRRLSQGCRNHFEALLKMKTVHGFFFDHFALFLKLHDDGLLIGFGFERVFAPGCGLAQPSEAFVSGDGEYPGAEL